MEEHLKYLRSEWKEAGNGMYKNEGWAKLCKEKYRLAVMESLKRPYNEFHEELKLAAV